VEVPETGLVIQQTDTYVTGREYYTTDITITNNGASTASGILYRAADAFLGGSDTGYGFTEVFSGNRSAVGCSNNANNTPADKIEEYIPLTGGNNYFQDKFDTVWSAIGSKMPFPDTCACSILKDNGLGISWNFSIPADASATYSHVTTFSPLGREALVPSKTADSPTSPVSTLNGYTITIQNPNANDVTVSSIADTLPAGFTYVPGSTTDATTNDPLIAGQMLTWSGSFNVPAHGSISLHFAVIVADTPGDYFNEVGGSAQASYNVISTGPTAKITVTAAPTPTPTPEESPAPTATATATATAMATSTPTATATATATATFTPTATATATFTPTATATATFTPTPTATATPTPTISPTTLTVAPASGVYGGTVNLSATLTSSGSPVGSKTINFTLNGNPVGSAITNGSGVATLTGVSLVGINPGFYPSGVGGSFAGDSSYSPSSGTASLTVTYGTCIGTDPGGVILPPINNDGSSVFRSNNSRTIPVKFTVCDASGNPISDPNAVFPSGCCGSITVLTRMRGTVDDVNASATTEIPDVAFHYIGNHWQFNLVTTNLDAGYTYTFQINHNFGNIQFTVAVK
jgi:uncharacterized repeat protein (TIGR01451 family)